MSETLAFRPPPTWEKEDFIIIPPFLFIISKAPTQGIMVLLRACSDYLISVNEGIEQFFFSGIQPSKVCFVMVQFKAKICIAAKGMTFTQTTSSQHNTVWSEASHGALIILQENIQKEERIHT